MPMLVAVGRPSTSAVDVQHELYVQVKPRRERNGCRVVRQAGGPLSSNCRLRVCGCSH